MKSEEHLAGIRACAAKLVNLCVEFGNENELDTPNMRFFRLFSGYIVAVDAVTQGIKECSGEFMKLAAEKPDDIRDDNL